MSHPTQSTATSLQGSRRHHTTGPHSSADHWPPLHSPLPPLHTRSPPCSSADTLGPLPYRRNFIHAILSPWKVFPQIHSLALKPLPKYHFCRKAFPETLFKVIPLSLISFPPKLLFSHIWHIFLCISLLWNPLIRI